MALSKRTGISKKKAVKEEKEPDIVCSGAELVPVKDTSVRCSECSNRVWRGELCHHHWKESQGFVFNENKKIYTRKKGK